VVFRRPSVLATRRFQVDRKVRLANGGTGAFRWMPTVTSINARATRLRIAKLASGEKATPIVPVRSVWPSPQSRSLGRLPSRSRARA